MCLVSGCPVYTPVDFLEFLPGNRNHHHFSDDASCHELQTGFPVALCSAAIQFSDRHRHRSFLLLRMVDLLVDVVDLLDVSVSEIAAFPPSERLAF